MSRKPVVLTTIGSNHLSIQRRLAQLGAQVRVVGDAEQALRAYKKATHVLLPGGADVHPMHYNQPLRYARYLDEERDELELQMADWCLFDRKPLLGICRGHQVIAVAAGGELHQDIQKCLRRSHDSDFHRVCVRSGSLLHTALGGRPKHEVQWVNSYHHQAVSKLPAGWQVTAQTPNGIIEGIGRKGLPVLSVQWHPEVLVTPSALNLFKNFLAL
jgi:putative glutamine amidotransferase